VEFLLEIVDDRQIEVSDGRFVFASAASTPKHAGDEMKIRKRLRWIIMAALMLAVLSRRRQRKAEPAKSDD
jgi:hypothetical protein